MKDSVSKTRKHLKGIVASKASDKTAVVLVNQFIMHPKYKKYMRKSKKYKAHDPEDICKKGDEVVIEECRPISKDKHFRVLGEVKHKGM